MAAAASALSPRAMAVTENDDSNISSPLSDVDDNDGNDEEIEHMQLDRDIDEDEDGDNVSSPPPEGNPPATNDASDSDSALSDARSDDGSDDNDNDTEAETERLYDTPRHQRQRDVTDDGPNQELPFEHTPSKLRTTAIVDKDATHSDDESLSGDDASPPSSQEELDESPTKAIIAKKGEDDKSGSNPPEGDRKRKRLSGGELSDMEQPMRKRPASVAATDLERDDETANNEDDATSLNPQSTAQSVAGDLETPQKTDPELDDIQIDSTVHAMRKTRNGSKRHPVADDAPDEGDADGSNGATEGPADEETDTREGDREDEVDEETDLAAKNAEELDRKQAAFKDWSKIEEMFGEFRDHLYKDRLQRLEDEEQSLLSAEPTHPEFLNMRQCLDDRLERKIREIRTEHEFRIMAHNRRAVAQRAQIWSQYFQAVRERREKTLEALNKEWYDVQSARRSAHSLTDCVLLFPKDPTQRIRNAVAYNSEVSTLAGLAKYEGFPAGPEMKGASTSEMDDDFAAMEHTRRGQRKHNTGSREDFQAPAFNRLDPAGEQFLKDTPWANPNHSAHKAYQQPLAREQGREELPGAAGPRVALPSGPTTDARTVMSQKASGNGGRISTSPELTRTPLAQSAPVKRVGNLASIGRSSKAAAV